MNEIVPIVGLSEPPKQGMFTLMESVFRGHRVRVLRDERGEPWFVAADIAKILAINHVSSSLKGLKKRKPGEVQVIDLFALDSTTPRQINGLAKDLVNIVSEAVMYHLVMRSDKPEAVEFQDWVTGEVLPSIRKTGSYFDPSADPTAPVATKERRKRVDAPRQVIEAGRRPMLGFEKIYIDNAVRTALEAVPVDLKVSIAMRVRRDIRLMAGNVRANELLTVEKNTKEAGVDAGASTLKSVLVAIPRLVSEYEKLLPPLLSRKASKKALPAPKEPAVVRKLELVRQGEFTIRHDGGPSIAETQVTVGGVLVKIPPGWRKASEVERDIGAWSDSKYHIFRSSFGKAAKGAGIPPEHIQSYTYNDANGNPRNDGIEYTPEAVACVLKRAHRLDYLSAPKPVRSESGDLFENQD
ncbi:BRO family protein [Ferrovum sp.]|uniref:BRO-N domain-containing protein n=1 Tax=Ferrovum sp. TaxID=2609467 RepID=UPI00261156DC|nr:BRO family protein [Ferrovum sp.]